MGIGNRQDRTDLGPRDRPIHVSLPLMGIGNLNLAGVQRSPPDREHSLPLMGIGNR